ncbi:MAG: hypothetical protein RR989_03650 [Ruthenibacterium sp.]
MQSAGLPSKPCGLILTVSSLCFRAELMDDEDSEDDEDDEDSD